MREEELIALQSQITTLRYGVTGCVLLIGFAAQQHGDRYLGWVVALALVPLVVLFSAIIWMGEYERVARAGHYIARLEGDISARLKRSGLRPLHWERWLREGGNAHSRLIGGHHRYLAIAGVFIGLLMAAVVMGLHFYWHKHSHDPNRHWLMPLAVVINAAILVTVFGYFRSSYERLRDYTAELEEPRRRVRQRVRMRLKLYTIFGVVGFVSAPVYSWPLGIARVLALEGPMGLENVPIYLIAWAVLGWMVLIPLISSRQLMRELLSERILPEQEIDPGKLQTLDRWKLLAEVTEWERERLRMVDSEELNAPSIGRNKHVIVTKDALDHREDFPGALAHEVGHHKLHHLHPLALSYSYLWPYLYFDERVMRRADKDTRFTPMRVMRVVGRVAFTVAALPGWLAWVILRWGSRTAEYDADRFACKSGHGRSLVRALRRHEKRQEERQPKCWRERVSMGWQRLEQGRAIGYLPVPNEHPTPSRRLKRVDKSLSPPD